MTSRTRSRRENATPLRRLMDSWAEMVEWRYMRGAALRMLGLIVIILVSLTACKQAKDDSLGCNNNESAGDKQHNPLTSDLQRKRIFKNEYYEIHVTWNERTGRDGFLIDDNTYIGWRTFHTFCHVCHRDSAEGGQGCADNPAADLNKRVTNMNWQAFVHVLSNGSQKDVLERPYGTMPRWDDNPIVNSRYRALFSYLKALAKGHLYYREGQPPPRLLRKIGDPGEEAGPPHLELPRKP